MRSEILWILSLNRFLIILSVIIFMIFFTNKSYASEACPAGSSLAYSKSISKSELPSYESWCSVPFCGGISYPTSVGLKYGKYGPTGQYTVRCPEQCFQTCDDEPEKDNECPWGFAINNSGSCVDDDNCAIGNSMGLGGSCEPDDCSAGSYLGSAGCTTCPQGTDCYADPIPDPEPDPDGGSGGGGNGGGSGGGGGSVPVCDTYSECRLAALQNLNCKENDRDRFIYQYIGPDDYAADCETCDGPEYLLYAECQSGACQFGYDSQNNRCWTVSCPHGDCSDPSGDGAFDPNPLPTNQDNNDERLSEIITAINSVRDSIEDNETPQKIEELKTDLVNKLESSKTETITQLKDNKTSNNDNSDSNTERLLAKLTQIENNTQDLGAPDSNDDYTSLLDDLNSTSKEILCEINPWLSGCQGYDVAAVTPQAAADAILLGIENSGIYSALNEFKTISINVTSTCPSSFRFQLSFIGTYTLDVCSIFEPVVPLTRALFIGFWGLVSFRALTDA
jgi:hypothetical protein